MKVDWYLMKRIGLKMIATVITELIRIVDMQSKESKRKY